MIWRSSKIEERQLALLWVAASVVVVGLSFVWPIVVRFLRPCFFRELTGIPCPTCGATRTATALTEGRILDALAINPLLSLAVAVFLVGGLLPHPAQ